MKYWTCFSNNIDSTINTNWAASWENQRFAYAKKAQISGFVFATLIVQYLYFLNT